MYTSQSPVFSSYSCTKMTECQSALLKTLPLNHTHRLSVNTAHSVYKNDRLSVSSTENSAIESHPQTVSQNSSFSEMTTENTDRVSVNACQDTDTLVQPCLARSSLTLQLGVQRLLYRKYEAWYHAASSRQQTRDLSLANITVSRESAARQYRRDSARVALTIKQQQACSSHCTAS